MIEAISMNMPLQIPHSEHPSIGLGNAPVTRIEFETRTSSDAFFFRVLNTGDNRRPSGTLRIDLRRSRVENIDDEFERNLRRHDELTEKHFLEGLTETEQAERNQIQEKLYEKDAGLLSHPSPFFVNAMKMLDRHESDDEKLIARLDRIIDYLEKLPNP